MVTPVCQHSKSNTGTRKNQPTGLDYYHIQANLASTTIFFFNSDLTTTMINQLDLTVIRFKQSD
jgi:hypothetical protein